MTDSIAEALAWAAAGTPPPESGVKPVQVSIRRWGTVTQTGPLRIRLDGDSQALPATPDALVGALRENDRVWCELVGRYIIVLGAKPTRPTLTGTTLITSLNANWTLLSGTAIREASNDVQLSVILQNKVTINAGSDNTVAVVAAGWRPVLYTGLAVSVQPSTSGSGRVEPNGNLQLGTGANVAANAIWVASASFYLP